MYLNTIRDNPGAHKKRRRVGRGIGSGRGKTSGRGGKGQTARSGVTLKGFEGGQMPLYRRLPKRGFTPYDRKRYAEISLGRLQEAVDAGHLNAQDLVTGDVLKKAGILSRLFDGVRLLGGGVLTVPLKLQLKGVTASARQVVEGLGGNVHLVS